MIRESWFFGRSSGSFTLQWHLTNACPFHCAHCYDRSERSQLGLEAARGVMRDMLAFCRSRRVRPHFCLTGGDPLAYPHFWELYGELLAQKLPVSILGNPLSNENLSRFGEVGFPRHYQVSLEGLEPYNDGIRGRGHFRQCLNFLRQARVAGLRTHVMLTLNRDNLEQVLPLAEELRGLVTRFTFNRLCQVGEGAGLELAGKERLESFLYEYLEAARSNPTLGCKDNYFNILQHREGKPAFGGCTGHGCGAAFNFVALLPEGEVHACRKFPSKIGNIGRQRLGQIYDSPQARAYRRGPEECFDCKLRAHCKGCMAVAYGLGLPPLKAKDPQCFCLSPFPTTASYRTGSKDQKRGQAK